MIGVAKEKNTFQNEWLFFYYFLVFYYFQGFFPLVFFFIKYLFSVHYIYTQSAYFSAIFVDYLTFKGKVKKCLVSLWIINCQFPSKVDQ